MDELVDDEQVEFTIHIIVVTEEILKGMKVLSWDRHFISIRSTHQQVNKNKVDKFLRKRIQPRLASI